MKQTNSAITFLMSEYRSVFRSAYAKGLTAAVVLAAPLVSTAQAADEVTPQPTASNGIWDASDFTNASGSAAPDTQITQSSTLDLGSDEFANKFDTTGYTYAGTGNITFGNATGEGGTDSVTPVDITIKGAQSRSIKVDSITLENGANLTIINENLTDSSIVTGSNSGSFTANSGSKVNLQKAGMTFQDVNLNNTDITLKGAMHIPDSSSNMAPWATYSNISAGNQSADSGAGINRGKMTITDSTVSLQDFSVLSAPDMEISGKTTINFNGSVQKSDNGSADSIYASAFLRGNESGSVAISGTGTTTETEVSVLAGEETDQINPLLNVVSGGTGAIYSDNVEISHVDIKLEDKSNFFIDGNFADKDAGHENQHTNLEATLSNVRTDIGADANLYLGSTADGVEENRNITFNSGLMTSRGNINNNSTVTFASGAQVEQYDGSFNNNGVLNLDGSSADPVTGLKTEVQIAGGTFTNYQNINIKSGAVLNIDQPQLPVTENSQDLLADNNSGSASALPPAVFDNTSGTINIEQGGTLSLYGPAIKNTTSYTTEVAGEGSGSSGSTSVTHTHYYSDVANLGTIKNDGLIELKGYNVGSDGEGSGSGSGTQTANTVHTNFVMGSINDLRETAATEGGVSKTGQIKVNNANLWVKGNAALNTEIFNKGFTSDSGAANRIGFDSAEYTADVGAPAGTAAVDTIHHNNFVEAIVSELNLKRDASSTATTVGMTDGSHFIVTDSLASTDYETVQVGGGHDAVNATLEFSSLANNNEIDRTSLNREVGTFANGDGSITTDLKVSTNGQVLFADTGKKADGTYETRNWNGQKISVESGKLEIGAGNNVTFAEVSFRSGDGTGVIKAGGTLGVTDRFDNRFSTADITNDGTLDLNDASKTIQIAFDKTNPAGERFSSQFGNKIKGSGTIVLDLSNVDLTDATLSDINEIKGLLADGNSLIEIEAEGENVPPSFGSEYNPVTGNNEIKIEDIKDLGSIGVINEESKNTVITGLDSQNNTVIGGGWKGLQAVNGESTIAVKGNTKTSLFGVVNADTANIAQTEDGQTVGLDIGEKAIVEIDGVGGKIGAITGNSGTFTLTNKSNVNVVGADGKAPADITVGDLQIVADSQITAANITSRITTENGSITADNITFGDGSLLKSGTLKSNTATVAAGTNVTFDQGTVYDISSNFDLNGNVTVTGNATVNTATLKLAGNLNVGTDYTTGSGDGSGDSGAAAAAAARASSAVGSAHVFAQSFDATDASVLSIDPSYDQDAATFVTKELTNNTIRGKVQVGKNAVFAVGFDSTDAAIQLLEQEKLAQNGRLKESNGAVAMFNNAVTIAEGAGMALNGDSKSTSAPKAVSNQLNMSNGGTLVLTDSAFNGDQAAVTFENKGGVTADDSSSIYLAGSFFSFDNTNKPQTPDSGSGTDSGSGNNTDSGAAANVQEVVLSDNSRAQTQGQNLKVFGNATITASNPAGIQVWSKNKLLNGRINSNGEIESLSYNKGEVANVLNGASQPVRELMEQVQVSGAAMEGEGVLYLAAAFGNSNGQEAEKAARTGLYAGNTQAVISAASTTTDAIANRLGMAHQNSPLMVSQSQYASLWAAPIYRHTKSAGFESQGVNYGTETDVTGAALGADLLLTRNFKVGAAFNLGSGSSDGSGVGSGLNNEFDYYALALYGGFNYQDFSAAADLTYTNVSSDFSGASGLDKYGELSGSSKDKALSFGLSAAYRMPMGGFELTPHAGLRYTRYDLDSYDVKSRAGKIAHVDNSDLTVFSMPFGISISQDIVNGDWTIRPAADFTLTANFGDTDQDLSTTFVGLNSTSLQSEVLDPLTYGVTLGVSARTKNLTFGVNAGYTGSANTDEFTIQATGRFGF